jgi:hypothetical protein
MIFILGTVFGLAELRRRVSLNVVLFAAVILGATATVISGEYRVSWIYLLLDIAQAVTGIALGTSLCRSLRRAAGSTAGRKP